MTSEKMFITDKANNMELESETSIKAKIEEAEKLIAVMGQEKIQLTYSLAQMMFDHQCWLPRVVDLNCSKEEILHSVIHERRKIDLLKQLPLRLRFTDNIYQKKSIKSCLSAQEISKHDLHFRMKHRGTKSLVKEKKLLKESLKEEEDAFASFWTQWENDCANASENITRYRRHGNGIVRIDLHTLKQTWWLQHQMPFLISKKDTKERAGEIRELEWRIHRCGVVLPPLSQKKEDSKSWTSLNPKKNLHDQIKLAGKKIEEARKTKLALGLGLKLSDVERKLVSVERDMESVKKKLTLIDEKKVEAHQCLLQLRNQQS